MTSNLLQNVWKFMGEKTSTTELYWKKNNSFLIENNSLDRYVLLQKKVFQNQKENLHNISMAGFLVGSS